MKVTNFSFSDENFARRIVSPDKVSPDKVNYQIYTLSGETFRRTNFSSLSPDEKSCSVKVKVSLGEVQGNLRGNNSFRHIVIILLGEKKFRAIRFSVIFTAK